MSRFLIATWDGAGNLVPTLGLARRLCRAGHDVRVLGHRSIDDRCGNHGWRFRAFELTPDVDSSAAHDPAGELSAMAQHLWVSNAVVDDVRRELAREAADVLVADCMLFGAMSVGQALGVPTAALFHGAFALFRSGPLADALTTWLPALNAIRAGLGLAGVERIGDVHDRCALSVVATAREFEPVMPRPANVLFAGPILDAPPLVAAADRIAAGEGGGPLVLVSFSTGNQAQHAVVQRAIDALASVAARAVVTTGPAIDPGSLQPAANVEIVRFVPHMRLLPRASLVVTHAGLGTVMAALAHGVPLLCMPLGRDQFFNASRVEAIGAGRAIGADAGVEAIAAAVRALLHDEAAQAAARRFATVIAGYGGAAAAVEQLEALSNIALPMSDACLRSA